jgi:hypothetical protein
MPWFSCLPSIFSSCAASAQPAFERSANSTAKPRLASIRRVGSAIKRGAPRSAPDADIGFELPSFSSNQAAARWWRGQDISSFGHEQKCQVVKQVWLEGSAFQTGIASHADVWRGDASSTPKIDGKFLIFGIMSSRMLGGEEPTILDQAKIACASTQMKWLLSTWSSGILALDQKLKVEISENEMSSPRSSTGSVTWHCLRLPMAQINEKSLQHLVLKLLHAGGDMVFPQSLTCTLYFRLMRLLGCTRLRALNAGKVERARAHDPQAYARGKAIVEVLEAQDADARGEALLPSGGMEKTP